MAEESGRKEDQSANFFDNNNAEAAKARERMASDCLEDLIKWLKEGGNVGIHGEQLVLSAAYLQTLTGQRDAFESDRRDQLDSRASKSARSADQARAGPQAPLHRISLHRPGRDRVQHCRQSRFGRPGL